MKTLLLLLTLVFAYAVQAQQVDDATKYNLATCGKPTPCPQASASTPPGPSLTPVPKTTSSVDVPKPAPPKPLPPPQVVPKVVPTTNSEPAPTPTPVATAPSSDTQSKNQQAYENGYAMGSAVDGLIGMAIRHREKKKQERLRASTANAASTAAAKKKLENDAFCRAHPDENLYPNYPDNVDGYQSCATWLAKTEKPEVLKSVQLTEIENTLVSQLSELLEGINQAGSTLKNQAYCAAHPDIAQLATEVYSNSMNGFIKTRALLCRQHPTLTLLDLDGQTKPCTAF